VRGVVELYASDRFQGFGIADHEIDVLLDDPAIPSHTVFRTFRKIEEVEHVRKKATAGLECLSTHAGFLIVHIETNNYQNNKENDDVGHGVIPFCWFVIIEGDLPSILRSPPCP
jgi:hypothetical protein